MTMKKVIEDVASLAVEECAIIAASILENARDTVSFPLEAS